MKKIFIFDFDGVLINSRQNMLFSWAAVRKKHNIKQPFKLYFKNIGAPFKKILEKIKINSDQSLIEKTFKLNSIKHFNKIRLYPDVVKVLSELKKKNIVGLLTSKDKHRTYKLLKKFKLVNYFNFIECPNKRYRGKPYPDQIFKQIKKYKIKKKSIYYIGDMGYDSLTAKRAGINFIFASYGYGKLKKVKRIKKLTDLMKISDEI